MRHLVEGHFVEVLGVEPTKKELNQFTHLRNARVAVEREVAPLERLDLAKHGAVGLQKLKEVHSATHPGAKLKRRQQRNEDGDDATAEDVLDALAKEANDDPEA